MEARFLKDDGKNAFVSPEGYSREEDNCVKAAAGGCRLSKQGVKFGSNNYINICFIRLIAS